jgi:hypothetical protein
MVGAVHWCRNEIPRRDGTTATRTDAQEGTMTQNPTPPNQWQPTNPPAPAVPEKTRSWFARHKILTAIGAVILLMIVGKALGGSDAKTDTASPSTSTPTAAAPAATPATPAPAKTTAAPKPAAAGIGTKVRDGKFEFVVTGVEDGGKELGDQYLKETAQGTFKLVKVSITNIGDKAQTMFDSNQKLIDDKGRSFEPNSSAALMMEGNSDVWIKPINPGNSVKGVLVYDMPVGAVPTMIELHDSAFSGGVKVNLK